MSFDLTELNGRKLYEREAGILLPVMSLPGKYGIGDLGNEARWFIDVLQNSGQQLWAMLPNGPVGYGQQPVSESEVPVPATIIIFLPTN